jgi:hypothetical protein
VRNSAPPVPPLGQSVLHAFEAGRLVNQADWEAQWACMMCDRPATDRAVELINKAAMTVRNSVPESDRPHLEKAVCAQGGSWRSRVTSEDFYEEWYGERERISWCKLQMPPLACEVRGLLLRHLSGPCVTAFELGEQLDQLLLPCPAHEHIEALKMRRASLNNSKPTSDWYEDSDQPSVGELPIGASALTRLQALIAELRLPVNVAAHQQTLSSGAPAAVVMAVETLADEIRTRLGAASTVGTRPIRRGLTFSDSTQSATLDGTLYRIADAAAYKLLKMLYRRKGEFVKSSALQRECGFRARPSEIKKRLPPPLREKVESKPGSGKGFRLVL